MKKLILVIVVIFLVGCSGQSQFISSQNHQNSQAGYLTALQSDSQGLIENALFQIANNFLYSNNSDFSIFKTELLRLTSEGTTPKIRTRAKLVYELIESPDQLLTAKIKADYHNSEKFFRTLSDNITPDLSLAGSDTK